MVCSHIMARFYLDNRRIHDDMAQLWDGFLPPSSGSLLLVDWRDCHRPVFSVDAAERGFLAAVVPVCASSARARLLPLVLTGLGRRGIVRRVLALRHHTP